MDELGSLIPSRRRKKTKEPDFGTYHHSTSVASKEVRTVVKAMFTDAFASIPFGRDDELRILDVGCGLGFLSCVSAEFYQTARITGIDTFETPLTAAIITYNLNQQSYLRRLPNLEGLTNHQENLCSLKSNY
jgi:2-polyprenyl-3-methyl-5-hydroxy-6-metoxy-1,4-benzoquinol methylase